MTDLFVYLLRSGACLALFYGFFRLVLMRDTNFALNRAFLLGSAVLSLGLPLLRVPSPFLKTVVDISARPPQMDALPALASPSPGIPIGVLLPIYAGGAGLMLVLFLVRIVRLALMTARCGCERHRGLRVVLCGHPGQSFSFFNFVFLNKATIPPGDIDRILAHELAHVRQRHSLDIVFSEFLTVIQWFNPFVWPYKRSLRETHEYLADRAVIAQGCSLARYQLLIVEQHVGGRLLELASGFRTSQIKRRITMLTKQETIGLARWKPLLILPLAVALVLAFAESRTIVQAGPASVAAPPAASAPSQELSEEEMAKALKHKMAQLEDMKRANAEEMVQLKEKLKGTTDPEAKAKIMAMMKEHEKTSFEIDAKARQLDMKKLEWAMTREGDPAKKADLEKKLQALRTEGGGYYLKPPAILPTRKMSEEEMAKATKEKAGQLEEMKKENSETMAKLEEKLETATDAESKAKIVAEMEDQKVKCLEIGAKERELKMDQVRMALARETDPAKKADMEKLLQSLKAEREDYQKKVDEVRKAEEKAKKAAEKK